MRASRRLLLFAACTLFSSQLTRGGESFDRLGRWMGLGWSDGYHACGSDCYRLGENLPPLSYSSEHSLSVVSQRHLLPGPSFASKLAYCDDANCDSSTVDQELDEFGSSLLPVDPYAPTDQNPLPSVAKPSPQRMPTPAEPLPAPLPAPKLIAPKPQTPSESELPAPMVDDDSQELPPPLLEPKSPSDMENEDLPEAKETPTIEEVRIETVEDELGLFPATGGSSARPKRIGTKYPKRLPSATR